MKSRLRLLTQCQAGVALIEFAIVFPVLLLMLIGTVEMARFAIIVQKIDKTVNAMADYLTQGTLACQADMDIFAQAANDIMMPFGFSGTIIFTSVVDNINAPPCTTSNPSCVSWQYTPVGAAQSQFAAGGQGSEVVLPGGYDLPDGGNVIAVEVFYNYAPMLPVTSSVIPGLAPQTLYRIAIYKPRQKQLTTLSCGDGGG